jgi:Tfp pilus assembly protein FimT
MLIVVVIVGGLALFSLPKFSGLTERSNIAAARQQVTAAIATARAAAIQKGSSATVRIVGDSLSVTVVNAGGVGTTTVIAPKPLHDLYGVVLSHKNLVDTTITFDTRGFARLGATAIIHLAKGARRDSVCLTISGQIMPRGCSL